MPAFKDNLLVTVSGSPGTGAITVSTAVDATYRAFAAGDNGLEFEVTAIEPGVGTETFLGTYTHSGTSLSRGTLISSTSGGRITLTSAATVLAGPSSDTMGKLWGVGGALGLETVSVTGATTLTSSAFGRMHHCTGTSADYPVTLPPVSGNSGKYIGFIMAAGLTRFVTLDGNASETIDGALTRVMWAQETALLYCDGSTWIKNGGKQRALYCHMAPSANATLVSGNELKSTLNATIADNSTRMADTSAGRMTVRRPGIYNLAVSSRIGGASGNIARCLGIGRKNGNASDYTVQAEISMLSGGFGFAYLSIPLTLSLTDYFELWGLQTSGTNQSWAGDGSTQQSNMSLIEVPQW